MDAELVAFEREISSLKSAEAPPSVSRPQPRETPSGSGGLDGASSGQVLLPRSLQAHVPLAVKKPVAPVILETKSASAEKRISVSTVGGPDYLDVQLEQKFRAESSSSAPVLSSMYKNPIQQYLAQQAQQKNSLSRKKFVRAAGGEVWQDPTMADWKEDDYRVFVGNLGNDVNDDLLKSFFSNYGSLLRVRVVKDRRTGKSKGFGFASFLDPVEYARVFKEMDGKFCGSHPVILKRSKWQDRNISEELKDKIVVPIPKRRAIAKPGQEVRARKVYTGPKPWLKDKNSWMGEGMI